MRLLSTTLRWALSVCALGACSSDNADPQSTPGTLTPCDPGAPVPLPITLGTVLAVGEDTDGTLYVIAVPTAPRRSTACSSPKGTRCSASA
jgi:hypothetical protein